MVEIILAKKERKKEKSMTSAPQVWKYLVMRVTLNTTVTYKTGSPCHSQGSTGLATEGSAFKL